MGLKYHSQGFTIYSNYGIKDPGTGQLLADYIQSDLDLGRVHDGYFIGDELWNWADSRMSGARANAFVSGLLLKSRKRGFSLVYTAQSMGQIDKRIRDNTDYIILPIMTIECDGERRKIQHSLLKPVSTKPFFELMHVHAFVFSANQVLVDDFSFRAAPIARYYNTNEEIEKLIYGGNGEGPDNLIYESGAKPWLKNGQETEAKFYEWLKDQGWEYIEWISQKKKSMYDHLGIKDEVGYYFDVVGQSIGHDGTTLNTKDKNWPEKVRWIKEYGYKPCIGGFLAFTEDNGISWRFLKINSRLPKGGITLGAKWREKVLTLEEILALTEAKQTEMEVEQDEGKV